MIFWLHHEEVEGRFSFDGRRDVRAFFELVREVGMKALVRIGPFDHGEVRNGGTPDWLIAKHIGLNCNCTRVWPPITNQIKTAK